MYGLIHLETSLSLGEVGAMRQEGETGMNHEGRHWGEIPSFPHRAGSPRVPLESPFLGQGDFFRAGMGGCPQPLWGLSRTPRHNCFSPPHSAHHRGNLGPQEPSATGSLSGVGTQRQTKQACVLVDGLASCGHQWYFEFSSKGSCFSLPIASVALGTELMLLVK